MSFVASDKVVGHRFLRVPLLALAAGRRAAGLVHNSARTIPERATKTAILSPRISEFRFSKLALTAPTFPTDPSQLHTYTAPKRASLTMLSVMPSAG